MLEDAWPLFGVVVETPRLTLRLPREDEIVALSRVAADGVHGPDERPFLTPWAEREPQERARWVLQGHWEALGAWEPSAWSLGLGVFLDEVPVGRISLRTHDFAVVREVTTGSWLGRRHQGHGLGTEARLGVLTLAFDHLGAEAALTEVFPDNHASQAVSRKLGYAHDGISRDARDGEALVSDRLRLTREAWTTGAARTRAPVRVVGVEECRPYFGLTPSRW